ncbi:MAG: hypothetical protein QXX48_04770 [Candidatus Korarchaeum sp.]
MRTPLALIALLLLIRFTLVEASPLGIEVVTPRWIDESSEFNLTIIVSGAEGELAGVRVIVLREEAEFITRELILPLSEGVGSTAIRMGPLGGPGAYGIGVKVSVANSTASLYEDLYTSSPSSRRWIGNWRG